MENHQLIIQEVANDTGIVDNSVHMILINDLGIHSITTKSTLKLISHEQYELHPNIS